VTAGDSFVAALLVASWRSSSERFSARATFRGAKPITWMWKEVERSDLTGRRRRTAERKCMPDALIVPTKTDLREIIRDARADRAEKNEGVG